MKTFLIFFFLTSQFVICFGQTKLDNKIIAGIRINDEFLNCLRTCDSVEKKSIDIQHSSQDFIKIKHIGIQNRPLPGLLVYKDSIPKSMIHSNHFFKYSTTASLKELKYQIFQDLLLKNKFPPDDIQNFNYGTFEIQISSEKIVKDLVISSNNIVLFFYSLINDLNKNNFEKEFVLKVEQMLDYFK